MTNLRIFVTIRYENLQEKLQKIIKVAPFVLQYNKCLNVNLKRISTRTCQQTVGCFLASIY